MSDKGWILIHRKIWDDEEYEGDPFSPREAWMWLISHACWENKTLKFNQQIFNLKRGQLVTSIRQLCKSFNWKGKTRVENYLRNCEKTGKITRQKRDRKQTIITICNYDTYQDRRDSDKSKSGTEAGQRRDRNKELKESKEVNKERSSEKKSPTPIPAVEILENPQPPDPPPAGFNKFDNNGLLIPKKNWSGSWIKMAIHEQDLKKYPEENKLTPSQINKLIELGYRTYDALIYAIRENIVPDTPFAYFRKLTDDVELMEKYFKMGEREVIPPPEVPRFGQLLKRVNEDIVIQEAVS